MIKALIAGHFADPFSVLGMHKTTAGLEVRALLPDATDVWVIEPKTGRKLAKWPAISALITSLSIRSDMLVFLFYCVTPSNWIFDFWL